MVSYYQDGEFSNQTAFKIHIPIQIWIWCFKLPLFGNVPGVPHTWDGFGLCNEWSDISLQHVFVLQWSHLLPLNIILKNVKQYINHHQRKLWSSQDEIKADHETVGSFVHVGIELRAEDEEDVEVELPNRIMSTDKVHLSLLPIIKSQLAHRNKLRIYKTLIPPLLGYVAKRG